MEAIAWVAAWHLQCCGEPFSIGSTVEWPVADADGLDEWLESVVGAQLAATVTMWMELHGGDDRRTARGTVASISGVCCTFAPSAGGPPNMLYPVRGSGEVFAVERADGWERGGEMSFVGYLVGLGDVVTHESAEADVH